MSNNNSRSRKINEVNNRGARSKNGRSRGIGNNQNAIPYAERRRINEDRQQYWANKRIEVSAVAYVPQTINVHQDGARSVSSSINGSTTMGSRVVSEQNNEYSGSIMGGKNEQARVRARNPANMNWLDCEVAAIRSSRDYRYCSCIKKDYVASLCSTKALNEADSNADICFLGATLLYHVHTRLLLLFILMMLNMSRWRVCP